MTVPNIDQLVALIREGGALVEAIIIIYLLVTEKVIPKGRLDDEKEDTKAAETDKKEALALAKEQTAATSRMADALEARNRMDERLLDRLAILEDNAAGRHRRDTSS